MFDSVPIGGIAQKFPQFDAPKLSDFPPVLLRNNPPTVTVTIAFDIIE
jgi:hypothetical protein